MPSDDQPEPTSSPTNASILVVDDEAVVREVLAAALSDAGHRVSLAEDGLAALEHLARNPACDLVVLDLTMPRLSGEETLRRIRALNPKLPILMTSGFNAEASSFAAALPDVRFLGKPFAISELLATVRELLSRT